MRGHRIAKDFEVAGPQVCLVKVFDDAVVGIRSPLADFMRDDGNVDVEKRLREVVSEPT